MQMRSLLGVVRPKRGCCEVLTGRVLTMVASLPLQEEANEAPRLASFIPRLEATRGRIFVDW